MDAYSTGDADSERGDEEMDTEDTCECCGSTTLDWNTYECAECHKPIAVCAECHTIVGDCGCGHCVDGAALQEE